MKKFAPAIITLFVSLYISLYIAMFFLIEKQNVEERLFLGFMGLAAFGLLIALVRTLIIRFKEIDKEEDNDLSKY